MAVYFVQRSDGAIKIGKSRNVSRRLRQLNADAGESLTLLGAMPGSLSVEGKLHAIFSADNIKGEWFVETEKLLKFISENCCPLDEISEPDPGSAYVIKNKIPNLLKDRNISVTDLQYKILSMGYRISYQPLLEVAGKEAIGKPLREGIRIGTLELIAVALGVTFNDMIEIEPVAA